MWVKWARRAAAAVLLAVALFVFGWVPWFFGGMTTTRRFQFPDRENQGLTPGSFDVAYDDVAFASADGVEIRGWWVPATDPQGTVVMATGSTARASRWCARCPSCTGEGGTPSSSTSVTTGRAEGRRRRSA